MYYCFLLVAPRVQNPCNPSPCGPNSQCRNINKQAVCSCVIGYIGNPPTCRPECVTSSECSLVKACINQKCVDPCIGTCGIRARCEVINHNPICSCPEQHSGDPFTRCLLIGTILRCTFLFDFNRNVFRCLEEPPAPPLNPCQPSPCGPNSLCKEQNGAPVCTCLPDFIGAPPNCKPECISSSECSNNLACINQKCRDPCPGSCGVNAVCRVVSHTPNCACKTGYTGDAFLQCVQIETLQPVSYINPCVPSPCGPNAICKEQNNAGSCTCLPNYIGNPYEGCRPECVLNTDCPSNRACIRNKCLDPCPGTCAANAECQVINHLPSCSCSLGYTGDPFVLCKVLVELRKLDNFILSLCL